MLLPRLHLPRFQLPRGAVRVIVHDEAGFEEGKHPRAVGYEPVRKDSRLPRVHIHRGE